MDFRILGPLEVRDRGRPLELQRRKPRALLGVLLLHAGEPLSSDALTDALWGGSPPRTARAALQNYVAQLRRALGPGLVASRGGSYVLEVTPEQIDLGRFERRVAEGRAAEGEERVEKLREALALWRGPPLADLAFEPFAAHEAARLEELRTAALEDLIDAQLACGSGPELVAELEQLIAEHPFRERLRGQLMLALYRSGRQADALEAYQATRRKLVDELGIEPSAALRELEQAILRQDASLEVAARPGEAQAAPEERRKTVTILFADIASPETADPELLHDSSVRALARVRTVLEEHGATIEQRAGDEVMAVFGIPQAHEDDALRAARAALELEVELAGLSDVLEGEGRGRIELRVAIETGEVLAGADEMGHGFAAGPAVTTAKRTLQRATAGEVLAGPATLRLLGNAAVLSPPSDGRNHASRIVELLEGGPALARQLEAPLVDREAELGALHAAFVSAVEERSCRLFLLLGEAGIGKTRLAGELTVELDGSATVLVGRCVSYGSGATFLPLAEVVRQAQERRPLRELLAGDEHAELIAARLADVTGDAEAPGPGGETFWAARRLFESLARERPLVLVFEDLHWAEPTFLDLLDYFADRATGAGILLVGLARPELLDQRIDWVDREAARLAPLSGNDSEALIENLGEARGSLRSQILRTAAGNPLFIEQLLAHARETGEPEALPPSLDALLTSRLDRLEPGELAVLQRAAVQGREFSRGALVRLLSEAEATRVDENLLAAVRKGLVHAGPADAGRVCTFRFHHVLIRDAAYATLPLRQRAELHERFGRWLEGAEAPSDELIGYHLEQAHRYVTEVGRPDDSSPQLAVDAGRRLATAGIRAAKTGDGHAATNLLTRASSLLDPEEVVRRDLLSELGIAYWSAGDLGAVQSALRKALEAALAANDERAELRARIELAYVDIFRAPEGRTNDLLSLVADAIPVLERARDDRTLGVSWGIVAHVLGGFHGRFEESAEAAERAMGYYERAGWPPSACVHELAAGLYYGPVPVAAALARCSELVAHADRGGEAHVLVLQAGLEAMAGRFDAARKRASRARAAYEELDWTDKIWENYAPIAGEIELMAGNSAEAERLLAESCGRLEAWGEQARLATVAARLAEALYRDGKLAAATSSTVTAERCAATDDASAQFSWRAVRAKLLAREGAFDEADALARAAVELVGRTDAVTQHAQVLLDAAEVASLAGRAEASIDAIEKAARLLRRKGNVASLERAESMLTELTSV